MIDQRAVTAAIPVYNGHAYIERALRSVLAQELPPSRIMVVDDASTDGTAAVVSAMACEHPSVELIQLAKNEGPSQARNLALRMTQTPFVAFLDADDEWTPRHLQLIDRVIAGAPDATLVFADCGPPDSVRSVEPEGARQMEATHVNDPLSVLLAENVITQSCVVVHRERVLDVGGYDATQRYAEDYDLWLRMALNPDARFLHVPVVTCIRHSHEDQVSLRHVDRMFRSGWAVRRRIALLAGNGSVLAEHVAPLHASMRSDLQAAWFFRNREYLRLVLKETEWIPEARAQTNAWRRRSAWQWPIWRGLAAVYDTLLSSLRRRR